MIGTGLWLVLFGCMFDISSSRREFEVYSRLRSAECMTKAEGKRKKAKGRR